MKKVLLILFIIHGVLTARSQSSMVDSAITIPFIGISYGLHNPQGDIKERFGRLSSIGGQFGIKLKSNVYMAFKMDYIFGDKVKEEGVLDNLRTSEGGIIEIGGELTDPILDMQGYSISLLGGYVFPLFGPNPNSGILLAAGPCFFQHSINIDYRNAQIPQLEGDNLKGYDRMTNGYGLNEFIGYMFYGKRKMLNFYAGFEFLQAWTKNRRTYNYDEMKAETETRQDNLAGFRIGWILTLYRRAPEQYYYH